MSQTLDKKEAYLYGTFLALVDEQFKALEKAAAGKLGFWGKGRVQARNKEMQKFLKKLVEHKISRGSQNPLDDLLEDLDFIETDQRIWSDVSARQLEYVRNVLHSL